MHLPTLETQFQRWRDRRDVDALADVFDRTAPSLMRLARHLAPAGVEAEDLLQTTFLSALEAPGGWDDERPLAPWLAGILGRRAARERRGLRSPEAERLHAPASIDPADAARDGEAAALVEDALGRLPERYRAVLDGRLLEGRAATEVAADLGRSPSTVHVQHHRGLRLLRRALPASLAPGAWGGPRELAGARRTVLHAARRRAGAGLLGSFGGAGLLGVVAAVVAAVLLGAWLLTGPDGDDGRVGRAGAVDEVAARRGSTRLSAPTSDAEDREAVPSEIVRVEDAPQVAVPETDPGDGAGEFAVIQWWIVGQVLAPAGLDHGDFAWAGTKVRASGPGVGMEFGVVRPDGSFRQPMLSVPPWERALIDEVPEEEQRIVFTVTHPDALPGTLAIDFGERFGDTVSVELELGPAGRLRGAATDAAGEDLSICFTQVYPFADGRLLAPAIDERGFEAPSTYDLLAAPGDSVAVVGLGGLRPAGERARVLAGAVQDLPTVVLEQGAVIHGQCAAPFEVGALVEARLVDASSSAPLGPLEVTWHRGRIEWALVRATVASDGTFELLGLAPGETYRVSYGDRAVVTAAGGERVQL